MRQKKINHNKEYNNKRGESMRVDFYVEWCQNKDWVLNKDKVVG